MTRFFNSAGPCDPSINYMLPPEERLPDLERVIERRGYFVVRAPRQSGKTTLFRALAERLTASGRYAALCFSCAMGHSRTGHVDDTVEGVLGAIEIHGSHLQEELWPPQMTDFEDFSPQTRLLRTLKAWAESCPLPLVLFFDDIDALVGDGLIAVLHQLHAGYVDRPEHFPQSIALIGLRDVRDCRLVVDPEIEAPGISSPFNIKVDSLKLRNFNAEEVARLYSQHEQETGQAFEDEAKRFAWELTRGQPWLVNALARQAVELADPGFDIGPDIVDAAREVLVERRETHLDSLVDRVREKRVRRVIEPILAGELLGEEVLDDDIAFVRDLGLVDKGAAGLEIANPIYREIVPRALTAITEESLPIRRGTYISAEGHLLLDRLLEDFLAFWREHGEELLAGQPYSEVAAQLVFMGFLHKVVNGSAPGGLPFIDREYAAGSGRIDLHLRWPLPNGGLERFAIELKVWRDRRQDPLDRGLVQLGDYLHRLGLDTGYLLIFDQRQDRDPEVPHGRVGDAVVGHRVAIVWRF
jgi:hypothetical protein